MTLSVRIPIKIRILGSGTSTGVPVIGCSCAVCTSEEPKDKRLRSSLLLSRRDNGRTLIIDTTPDFRQQMLDAKASHLDEVLYTHTHADHCHGFDDLRALYFREKKAIRCWIWAGHEPDLRRRFSYAFASEGYVGTPPQVELRAFESGPLPVLGIEVEPLLLPHGHMQSVGFRFGSFAYATDFKSFGQGAIAAWKGKVKTMIASGLRFEEHNSHSTIGETVALFKELGVERGYLTHLSHSVDHRRDSESLPPNVSLAYDGCEFDLDIEV